VEAQSHWNLAVLNLTTDASIHPLVRARPTANLPPSPLRNFSHGSPSRRCIVPSSARTS